MESGLLIGGLGIEVASGPRTHGLSRTILWSASDEGGRLARVKAVRFLDVDYFSASRNQIPAIPSPGDGPFLQVGMIVYGTPMKWTPFHPSPWDYPVAPCTGSLVSAEPGSQLKRFCRSGTPAECFSILRRTPPHLLASYGRETDRMTQHQPQGTQMSERCRRLSTATPAPPSIQPCYR